MTETAIATAPRRHSDNDALVARRYRAERRFKAYGIAAIAVTAVFLVLLFADILGKGLHFAEALLYFYELFPHGLKTLAESFTECFFQFFFYGYPYVFQLNFRVF